MRRLSTLLILISALSVSAQETSPFIKFGKVNAEHLQKKIYALDSNASAIVLSDRGECALEGNSKGWFSLHFKRHRVVHILNKNGYDEADVVIPLYDNGEAEEKLENLKAVTYNLENGKIVETKLEKSQVFSEKLKKNYTLRKFTMPNVREGCIIEFEYTVSSDFIENLDVWEFQGESPVLWSEYKLSVPQFFTYAFLSHGYHPMYINDRKDRLENFTIIETRNTGSTERYSFTSGVTDFRWVMKDVPELREERFTSALSNHISSIEFQLASRNYPLTPKEYKTTWPALTKSLIESEDFGTQLKANNGWLSDDIKPLMSGIVNEDEKARRIFNYVRDNFTCTEYNALYTTQTLKNVAKTKKGTVSEINLLLTAMLRYAGLNAEPVILSTRDHGYVLENYPLIRSFNYVIVQYQGNKGYSYLDASHSGLGFGKLLPESYNGHARVVDEPATPVYFSADSLKENKISMVIIANAEDGKWLGSMNQTPGYFESYAIRNKISSKGQEDFFKEIEKAYGTDARIKSPAIDSLTRLDDPINLHYEFELSANTEDILYVNPMFGEGYKNNPFKSSERFYPVEMPFTMDETYLLTMEVPSGYVVDELPKQIIAKLDEQGSAFFEYLITYSGNTISLRSRVKINRTVFMPDEYEVLREFFNHVVKKQNEQIVFKKKK